MKKLLGVLALVLSVSSLAMADQDTVKLNIYDVLQPSLIKWNI